MSPKISECPLKRDTFERQFHLPTINFQENMLVFRWVDTGESRLEVLETTGGYDVEAFLPSTGEKARLVLIYLP